MARKPGSTLNSLLTDRILRRWARAAEAAHDTPMSTVAGQARQALVLRTELDRLIQIADDRKALAHKDEVLDLPHSIDWVWRPRVWINGLASGALVGAASGDLLCEGICLFHDCDIRDLSLTQFRIRTGGIATCFGLRLDVYDFSGSFVSLAVDLPPEALSQLRSDHVIRVDAKITREAPLEIYLRLNVQHGPNTEKFVRKVPLEQERPISEFDLAHSAIDTERVERAWLDLIVEHPAGNAVIIDDLVFSRFPRAQF